MRDIMLGILSGIGEAHQKQQQNLLSQEVDRRKNLAQFWKSQAEHPDTRPEARDIATRKYLGIVQTPFDKKLPKEIETIDDYLTVQPQQGTSWPGAERQIPMMPSPSPKPEGVAPTAPPESSISAPMPAPPPEYRVPAQYTMQERGAQRRQAAQETADIAVDAETRKAQAEAKAKRDFAVPSIRPYGPDSSGLYKESTGEIKTPANPARIANPPAPKSLQPKEMKLKAGGHTGLLFNPDPANPGYFRKDPVTKQLVEVPESELAGPYLEHQPPAAILIGAAAEAAAQGLSPEMQTALARATLNMPGPKQLSVVNKVKAMAKSGDLFNANDTIRQAALESESVATQTNVRGRREVLKAITEIEKILNLPDVQTGYIRGTLEETARDLGTSTNPNLRRFGQRLILLNQAYRRSMTGAQFSQAEADSYAQVFPNAKNTAPVNAVDIEELRNALNDNDYVYWFNKLGPGWSDSEIGAGAQAPPPTPPPGGRTGAGAGGAGGAGAAKVATEADLQAYMTAHNATMAEARAKAKADGYQLPAQKLPAMKRTTGPR